MKVRFSPGSGRELPLRKHVCSTAMIEMATSLRWLIMSDLTSGDGELPQEQKRARVAIQMEMRCVQTYICRSHTLIVLKGSESVHTHSTRQELGS
jgi:hypothetical protein